MRLQLTTLMAKMDTWKNCYTFFISTRASIQSTLRKVGSVVAILSPSLVIHDEIPTFTGYFASSILHGMLVNKLWNLVCSTSMITLKSANWKKRIMNSNRGANSLFVIILQTHVSATWPFSRQGMLLVGWEFVQSCINSIEIQVVDIWVTLNQELVFTSCYFC